MRSDRTAIALFAFLLFVFLSPVAVLAQDLDSAKAFLQSVYGKYQDHGKGVGFSGPGARQVYHTSLIALIRQDEKANGPDVGVLDGDPICSCQDWKGIFNLKIAARLDGTRALADVSFALFNEGPNRDPRLLQITLVPENGAWRIWNIVDKTDPKAPDDFRVNLVKEIENLTRHKAQ